MTQIQNPPPPQGLVRPDPPPPIGMSVHLATGAAHAKLLGAFDELLEANLLVKQTCPDTWREQMRIYRLLIKEQLKLQRNIVFAAIILAAEYDEKDATRMWIYATAVEMITEGGHS